MPQKIAREDFLISISRRDAIRDPVHAPVPGSGIIMATVIMYIVSYGLVGNLVH